MTLQVCQHLTHPALTPAYNLAHAYKPPNGLITMLTWPTARAVHLAYAGIFEESLPVLPGLQVVVSMMIGPRAPFSADCKISAASWKPLNFLVGVPSA